MINELNKKLEHELKFLEENVKIVYTELFNKLTPALLALQPTKITFEITFEDSLQYKMLINNVIIFIDAYIESDSQEEVIYSFYNSDDKKFIKSYTGNMETALEKIKIDLTQ